MAVLKFVSVVHPSSKGGQYTQLAKTINYALNSNKTGNKKYAFSQNCLMGNALNDMVGTKVYYGKTSTFPHERYAYHWVVSWAPDENVSPETAVKILKELCEEIFSNKYEVVCGVHVDKEHMHGHIVFNSVSFENGAKFYYADGDWAKMYQPILDKICKDYGLETLEEYTGTPLNEYNHKKDRYYKHKRQKNSADSSRNNTKYHNDTGEEISWSDFVKNSIDEAIYKSSTYEEFEKYLKDQGYDFKSGTSEKYGPYISLRAPGMNIHRKTYQLGAEYSLSSIRNRIVIKDKPLPQIAFSEEKVIVVPVHTFVRCIRKNLYVPPGLKMYWRMLYNLGLKPFYTKCNYKIDKDTLKAIKALEKEIDLIVKYNATKAEDIRKLELIKKEEYEKLLKEQKLLIKKHEPYKKMLYAYGRSKRLKTSLDEYEAGIQEAKPRADEYKRKERLYRSFGFTADEIESYKKDKIKELDEMKKKLRDAAYECEIAMNIQTTYAKNLELYTTDEEKELKEFYNTYIMKGRTI